jgi:hypothetical protein
MAGYVESNAFLYVDWRSSLQTVEDKKKDLKENPVVDREQVQ